MTKLQKQYEPYNSSWGKFLGCIGINIIARNAFKTIDIDVSCSVDATALTYLLHNAYSQYKYNQSLEHEIKVEINGVEETVKASPMHLDWYVKYTGLCLSGFTIVITNKIFSLGIDGYNNLLIGGILCKLISLKDTYLDFQYTDSKGNIISPEIVKSGFIGYIDDSRDNEAIETVVGGFTEYSGDFPTL